MGLDVATGTFAANVGVGNQSVAGLGFQPKLVFFMMTERTAAGVESDGKLNFGVADGSNEWYISYRDDNNVGTTIARREARTTGCINLQNPNFRATFVSMDAGGFTINISVASGIAHLIHYLAIGGSDISNVAVGKDTMRNSVGTKATAGLGFQPTGLIIGTISHTAEGNVTEGLFSLGFASGTSNEGCIALSSRNGVLTSDCNRLISKTRILETLTNVGAIDAQADLQSFDAGGFTLNYTDAPAAANEIYYVAFNGGARLHMGDFLTQTGTGNFSESGVGFQPDAGIFLSVCHGTAGSVQSDLEASMGFAVDSSNRNLTGSVAEDAQGTSDTDQYNSTSLIYQNYDFAQSQEGAVDFVSWDSDGFTMNQTDADPSQNEVIYFVFGAAIVILEPGLITNEAEVFPLAADPAIGIPLNFITNEAIMYGLFAKTTARFDSSLGIPSPGMAEYKFLLKNRNGELVAVLDRYKTAVFQHKDNNLGMWAMELFEGDPAISIFENLETPYPNATLDYIFEAWRRNLPLGLNWYKEFEGVYLDFDDELDNDDLRVFIPEGRTLNDFLDRTDIARLATGVSKLGPGESVMKEYVYEELGAGATVANNRLVSGVMPNLSIQADLANGALWTGSMEQKPLFKTLQEIALATGVSFDIVNVGSSGAGEVSATPDFQFRTYWPLRGIDRRKLDIDDNGLNEAGNVPVVFSAILGNMEKPKESVNYSKSKNTIIAVGGGQGDQQIYDIYQDFDAVLLSPWNMRTKILSKTQSRDTDGLLSSADAEGNKQRARKSFDFNVTQTEKCYYGLHYHWGDWVSAIKPSGELVHRQITETTIRISDSGAGQEQIQHTFEEIVEVEV